MYAVNIELRFSDLALVSHKREKSLHLKAILQHSAVFAAISTYIRHNWSCLLLQPHSHTRIQLIFIMHVVEYTQD